MDGGEIWHGWFAARGRMLEYTLELEQKIREAVLKGKPITVFFLALCGTGFEWHESQLEDFVDFYRTGRHRSDDPFAKMEAHCMAKANLSLDRTVTRFVYVKRKTTIVLPERLNWNVRGAIDPEFM